VITAGFVCGARFFFTDIDSIESLFFILLIFIASAGIGMLIGTFVKNVHGAIMSGVGLTVVSAALSGVMTPYAYLPSVLQDFVRIYPIHRSIQHLLIFWLAKNMWVIIPLALVKLFLLHGLHCCFSLSG
jgi:ABC-type multidrug transport system permease subunit